MKIKNTIILILLVCLTTACKKDLQIEHHDVVFTEEISTKQTSANITLLFDIHAAEIINAVDVYYWIEGQNNVKKESMSFLGQTASINLQSLSPDVTYCVQYAIMPTYLQCEANSHISKFTTINHALPNVQTLYATDITPISASLVGSVTDNDAYQITERGFYCGLSINSEIGRQQILCGSGEGNFIATANNLRAGAIYYFYSYAISRNGIAYGDTLTFKTLDK